MDFYRTKMGRRFFTRQLPRLIKALEDIAKGRAQPVFAVRRPETDTDDILSDLYCERYAPDHQRYRENDPLDREVREAMEPLLRSLSPEQEKLFLQYETAVSKRAVDISERAYKDGARLVVQVLMAGCVGHRGDTT